VWSPFWKQSIQIALKGCDSTWDINNYWWASSSSSSYSFVHTKSDPSRKSYTIRQSHLCPISSHMQLMTSSLLSLSSRTEVCLIEVNESIYACCHTMIELFDSYLLYLCFLLALKRFVIKVRLHSNVIRKKYQVCHTKVKTNLLLGICIVHEIPSPVQYLLAIERVFLLFCVTIANIKS